MKDGLTLKHVFGNRAKPKQLIVVFHGLKTDSGAMVPAVHTMLSCMKSYDALGRGFTGGRNPLVLAPEAPYKMAVRREDIHTIRKHYPSFTPDKSRAWFKIKGNNLVKMLTLKLAIYRANKFIDKQLKKYGLTDKDLVLMGYSQGGMMALYTGLSRNKPCAGIISHSGFYMGDQGGLFPARSRPPVMTLMGADDALFNNPESRFPQHDASVKKLRKQGVEVTNVMVPRLGHDYSYVSMRTVACFADDCIGHKQTDAKMFMRKGGDYSLSFGADRPGGREDTLRVEDVHLHYQAQNGETISRALADTRPWPLSVRRGAFRWIERVVLETPDAEKPARKGPKPAI